jgi:RNA polymerase sigma factor (sigma-70 family)
MARSADPRPCGRGGPDGGSVLADLPRARARFDPTRSFGAWARRIASNAALDHLRAVRRQTAALPALPSAATHSAAERDLQVRIERAFVRLPPKLRVVADLAFVDGWPQDEIAEALGISRTAVKFRAIRAKKWLINAFEKEGIVR